MSMPIWIRHVFARPATRPIRKAPHRSRLALETLEDRWVPSTFVVNNPTDTSVAGQVDLREAIAAANATTTSDTITFDAAVFATPQTITLAGSALELGKTTGTLTITGSAAGVTVSGGGASEVLLVDANVTASVSGLTITGGKTAAPDVGCGGQNNGTLSLTNCTVSGYYGYIGGGFFNNGPLSLTNCTVAGNTAFIGAGVYNTYTAPATLINCTVSGNSASLLFGGFAGSTATAVGNTIIAGNTALLDPDVVGLPKSLGNNLIGITGPLAWVSSDLTGTALAPLDPVLAPLGNYGGPTETTPLLPGSPAIGAGNVALIPTGISTDQRGAPRLLNGNVDIGAFESQGFTLTVDTDSTPQSADIGTTFANPLGVEVTAKNPIEPVDGGIVRFFAIPAANGASAIFSASSAIIAANHASITAAPDNVLGEYQVNAIVSGQSEAFDLTNTGTPFTSLIVNTTTDALVPGAGILSLREAVAFANLDTSGISTITFDPSVFAGAQKITLTLGALDLSNPTETETITGPAAGLTLDGGGASGVFNIDGGVTASISGMTITDGKDAMGGGINNYGVLTLANCTVSGSSATYGGGLNNGANATATLTDCTISGNSATFGGGLYNYAHATITVTDSTVSGNNSAEGGGMMNGPNGTATLTSSTVSGNSSNFGGGILNFSTLTLTQSTIADNSATYSGGGLYSLNGTTTTVGNTIVAGNTQRFSPDIIGGITSLGNNLIGNASNSTGWISSDLTGTNLAPIDPVLAPLGNYGGPTETMPLLPGSPAIAAGNVSLIPIGTTTDQRGEPRTLSGTVDIGAFESQGFTITVVPGSTPQSADIGTAFANPLAVTITANNPVEPVDGGIVTFIAHPAASGASAIFSASSAVIVGGEASVTAAPDNATGEYQVDAVASNLSASFDLTNTGTPFTSLTVNTTVDSLAPGAGLLSLREAVAFANSDTTGNATITFDPTVFASVQTIDLTLGQFELDNPSELETITGPAAGVMVDGGALSRVFQIDAGVTASISGLTITDGSSTIGGGVLNFGTLTLTDCTVSGNTSSGTGGGIMNTGTLTLDHTTVTNNSTKQAGGGIYSSNSLTLTDCTISDNTTAANGGGVYNAAYATASLTGTTVSGNSGSFGGGIDSGYKSTITLSDCTISGNSASGSAAGLLVDYYAMATLTGCTISGNTASNDGGGIVDAGTLAISDSTIENNNAVNGVGLYLTRYGSATLTDCAVTDNTGSATNGLGGGVISLGKLTMVDSTVTGNTAAFGGGILNLYGTLTLTDCTISGNSALYGAGIYQYSGTATLTGTTISDNTILSGSGSGGGIYSNGHSTLTLTNCTISGNSALSAGGGLLNSGYSTAALTNTTISDNTAATNGGGLYNVNYGAVTLTNCTVSGNTANANGGGLYNGFYASATLTNTTISGNTATSNGGGLYNAYYGSATLINCTISGNSASGSGGGIYTVNGTTSIGNTIVALNLASSGTDVQGPVVSKGNNLVGVTDGSSGWVASDLTGTSAQPLNPLLAPLGNYGGPTETMPLLPGSLAIAAGNVSLILSGTTTDQRGEPRLLNGAVDIGAFESQGFTITVVSGSTPQSSDIGTAFANPLAVTVTANNPLEPVDGGIVTYVVHAAANGASAIVSASSSLIAGGEASVTAAPDNVLGEYQVDAVASGVSASFDLTNTGTPFTSLTVNTTVDAFAPGAGLLSLREAIAFANLDTTGNATITFDPTVFASAQVIDLSLGQLALDNLNETETITGPAAGVTVDAGDSSRVFQVDAGVTASISELIIRNGNSDLGGGLLNFGTLTLTDSTVSGSGASGNGGGIMNLGTLTLTDSTVSDNFAGGNGGGVYNAEYATATFIGSTVSGNSGSLGGGMYSGYDSTITLTNCTISGNSGTAGGGLYIYYSAVATVTGSTVSGNTASNRGGGIDDDGTLAISDSTIENNKARSGGGLNVTGYGSATLTDCAVTGNSGLSANSYGGGVTSQGKLKLSDSTVTGNTASVGGGIVNEYGTATLTDSTISGNTAKRGGGIYVYAGTTSLTDCTISGNTILTGGNSGGGIYNGAYSTLSLKNSTISGNSSQGTGGGIYNGYYSSVGLINCTISGNTANTNGGGLYNGYYGSATLINCTISGNSASGSGGGIYNAVNGTANIGNTIIALNAATTGGPDAQGTIVSKGNNLIGITDGSTGWVDSDLTGTSAQPLDPLLAPLGNYGGPTQTMALLPGSLAIDAGNNALIPSIVTTDQRGLPRIVNTTVDIGAFESSGFTIAVSSGDAQSALTSTDFADPLVVTVTANNADEPVAGGVITFTAPPSGATATLSDGVATIDDSGDASVDATANEVGGAYSVSATASGITTPASFDLTNMWISTFSELTSPTIVYGTATTEFTGNIGVGTAFPAGSTVSVTLDSVTMTGVVDASGNFSVTFTTASLGVAGSPYTVAYAFAGNATFAPATDTTTTLTVTKADATVVVTPYTVTYNGVSHTATSASITGVTGQTGTEVGVVTLDTTHTNAGTYGSDSWSFAGTANYNDITSTPIKDIIGKANATVFIQPYNVTYDGTAHTATITSITGVNGESGDEVGTVTLDSTHTNAGTYASDSWSFTGSANYNDILSTPIKDIIDKANATVFIQPYNVTYDGTAHTATITSITGVNGESGDEVGTVTLDSTHTNAGTYGSDSWSFAGTANYNDITSTPIKDIIGKANATVVVTPYSVTYDGTAHSATITSITGVKDETGDEVGTVTLDSTHTNAGTYASDSWSFAGAANYNDVASTAITDIIGKADATVVVTPYSVTYTGTAHTATITSITGVNGETGAAVGTVTLDSTHTNVGTYTSDSWSFTGAGNYNDIASTTITDIISPAMLTITANDDNKVYGTLATFSGMAFKESGLATSDSITGVTETSDGAPTSAVVANYDIVPSAATGSGLGNYTIVYVNGTLTVAPAGTVTTVASSVNPSVVGSTVTFTATLTPNSGAFDNGGTVQFVVDGANFGVPITPLAGQASIADSSLGQGGHTVTAIYSGDTNLNGSSGILVGGQVVTLASGQVSGTVFRDFNLNGHQDAGEPGVAGQTVFLDLNNSGTFVTGDPTATTDANGSYSFSFSGLQPGAYNVRQVKFGGARHSAPPGGSFTVMAGSQPSFANLNFAEVATSVTVPLTLPPTTPFPSQGSANADYVQGVYRALLNRNADPGGLAFWTGVLNGGLQTRLEVVEGIRNSHEHFTQEVDAFYKTLLNRSADPQGESFWVGNLQAGMPEEQVTASFLNSPEFLGKGDKFFVDSMYNSLLGRQADPVGEAFWLSQLGDDPAGNPVKPPSLTHAQVIADFIYSTESFDRLVQGSYAVLLQRLVDVDGLNSWINQLQQGVTFATISEELVASSEFFNNATAND